jgi:hypothetical protein
MKHTEYLVIAMLWRTFADDLCPGSWVRHSGHVCVLAVSKISGACQSLLSLRWVLRAARVIKESLASQIYTLYMSMCISTHVWFTICGSIWERKTIHFLEPSWMDIINSVRYRNRDWGKTWGSVRDWDRDRKQLWDFLRFYFFPTKTTLYISVRFIEHLFS